MSVGEVVWERDRKCSCVMTMTVDATVVERHRVDSCPVHGVLGAVPKRVLDEALAAAGRVAAGIPELRDVAPERLAPILWAAAPYVRDWVAATMTAPSRGETEVGS